MKKLLLPILLLISTVGLSQKIGFYGKINPVAFIPSNKPLAPGGLIGAGARLGRWTTVGIAGGYFKLSGDKNGIAPVGLDLNITDFGRKKIMPAISAHIMYPIHSGPSYSLTNGNGDYYGSESKLDGKIMIGGSAGVSLPYTTEKKLIVSIGYTYLSLKKNPLQENLSTGMVILSIAAIL